VKIHATLLVCTFLLRNLLSGEFGHFYLLFICSFLLKILRIFSLFFTSEKLTIRQSFGIELVELNLTLLPSYTYMFISFTSFGKFPLNKLFTSLAFTVFRKPSTQVFSPLILLERTYKLFSFFLLCFISTYSFSNRLSLSLLIQTSI
jgi:uncharacterized membrane protein